MRPVQKACAIVNLGLQGDAHALRDSPRQILLIESETLDQLDLVPGDVKENITTSGISLAGMQRGDELRIGGEVVLEITKPCSPCHRMDELRPGLSRGLAGRRGMLARVLEGGIIGLGDRILPVSKA